MAGATLALIGYLSRTRRTFRRVGTIWLAIWLVPAIIWGYAYLVLTERDRYRTLTGPEVVYAVALPAGTEVNYRKSARRGQWVVLGGPQVIGGVEYAGQVSFCGGHVCSGTLARDQVIQGMRCRGGYRLVFETDGRCPPVYPPAANSARPQPGFGPSAHGRPTML